MWKWRGRETARRPARGFNGLLDVHSEVDHVDQRLHGAHDLIIASGAAEDRVGEAVFHDERALQSTAWALARLECIRFAGNQRVIVASAVEQDAGVSRVAVLGGLREVLDQRLAGIAVVLDPKDPNSGRTIVALDGKFRCSHRLVNCMGRADGLDRGKLCDPRVVGRKLEDLLKQPFVIVNRPGAGSVPRTVPPAPPGYCLVA